MANGTIGVSQIDVLTTSGTGTLSIVPPATNTNRTLTLPDGTGTIVANGVNGSLVSGTAVTCANQTSIDFTGIPSWVKRITVMFSGVSTSGTSLFLVQLGDAGGIETTGYVGGIISVDLTVGDNTGGTVSTAGMIVGGGVAAATYSGTAVFSTLGSNIWVGQSNTSAGSAGTFLTIGNCGKTLSDTLTQVRITTVNGTDTFDTTPSAGKINIMYE